jgi:integrase/recombinase XerD
MLKSSINISISGKLDKAGTMPILITVLVSGKRYRRIIERVDPKYWDHKKSQVKTTHPNAHNINLLLRQITTQVQEHIITHKSLGTPLDIPAAMLPPHDRQLTAERGQLTATCTLYDVMHDYLQHLTNQAKIGYTLMATSVFNKVKDYSSDLPISEVDTLWVSGFHGYCNRLGNKNNTIRNNIRTLRNAVSHSIKSGRQITNPFASYQIKPDQVRRTKLSMNDIVTLSRATLTPQRAMARDVFLFAFYNRGMRVSDVIRLQRTDIIDGRIVYRMGKSRKIISIKIIPQVREIIDRYQSPDRTRLFPYLSDSYTLADDHMEVKKITSRINKHLFDISKLLSFPQRISMHIARHSFAAIASTSGISSYAVQQLLGHSSLQMTEVYLKSLLNDELDDAMSGMFD